MKRPEPAGFEPRVKMTRNHPADARAATILLVEDERLIRIAVSRELANRGYQVIATASAEEALLFAGSDLESFGLLLTDVVLPGLSGVELVERLRERGMNCPVLYMSALPADQLHRLRIEPAMPVLEKPFETRDLLARVEQLLAA